MFTPTPSEEPKDTVVVETVEEAEDLAKEGYHVVMDSDLGSGGEV